ncbi:MULTISPECIES: phosphoethanolamine transferase [Thalassospira]|jgi:lipid A ethanolaminephosphotransferase|uniref:phosphoethanolamine transferase n=1 Tax=Thalassospira TaxID=168934 RepID=UPI00028735D3|nr:MULTISPECIES: phosphoethanolamine--lipid A transferase [Thalassospira]EKF07359.1 putative sulfatase [Thalassospira profundimaris WP0211]
MRRIRSFLHLSPIDYRFGLLTLAAYFTLVLNWKVLSHFYGILQGLGDYDMGFAISAPFVLICASLVVFTPFSWRYLFKPFFVFLIITGALAHYAMLKYGIVFDRGMIENVVETNQGEALSYFNLQAVLWFAVTGLLPAAMLILVPLKFPKTILRGIGQRLVLMILPVLVLGGIGSLYFKDYASVGRNHKVLGKELVPSNYIAGTIQLVKRRYLYADMPFQTIGQDARKVAPDGDNKPTLMFLVIGETARAQSVAANGYTRPTSPFTSQIDGMLAFQDVSSCGTATAVSVPCMFSPMDHAGYDGDVARHSESLMDVLTHAGVDVLWKENDEGCKGVCDRVRHIDISPDDFPGDCVLGTCFDAVMLRGLEGEVASGEPHDQLIAFHLMGSHGPTYYKRYPDEHRAFVPDCPRSDIENCSAEELINTYDNTIRYTDFIVAQLTERLKAYQDDYNVVLLYVSDHGESLGEGGLYLHGAPYMLAPTEQTKVPMMIWMSDGYADANRIERDCLAAQAQTGRFSHDNLFSTVLGAMHVATGLYRPETDIFAACGAPVIHAARR